MRVCISPPAIFNVVFDEYSFSIILNLFDNNDPYTLGTHKSKMFEQNASYMVENSEIGAKKLTKFALKIVQKALKLPLKHLNFQKFSVAACPRTPYRVILLFRNLLQINSAWKKNMLKNVKIWRAPP